MRLLFFVFQWESRKMLRYAVVIALVLALALEVFSASLAGEEMNQEAQPLEQTPADDRSFEFIVALGAGMKKFFEKLFVKTLLG